MRQHTLGISRQSHGKMAIVNEEKIICALDNRSKKKEKRKPPVFQAHTLSAENVLYKEEVDT